MGRNSASASYANLDASSYGTTGQSLDDYNPNYDVAGESAWTALQDETGHTYYSNSHTGEVTWDKPANYTDSLDAAIGVNHMTPEQERDKEIPFLKDMVRNCPTKSYLQQFLNGPENYLRHLNQNHGPEGTNVFHHACIYNPKLDVVDLLVSSKAEINKFSNGGLTAVDLCKNAGRIDVARYLLARGGMTRLVFDAHQKRSADRRENLKKLHQKLPSAMRALMKMMQSDFEDVRIQIVEVDRYVEVRWAISEVHDDAAAILSYMESIAAGEDNVKELRLERSQPWAEFSVDESLGPLLKYRFKPPWFDGYDADNKQFEAALPTK